MSVKRCKRLKIVEGKMVDRTLNLHKQGRMSAFWDARAETRQ